MLSDTALRLVLPGLVLTVTAGAAVANVAQDCRDATLTAEARQSACEAAAAEAESFEELAYTHLLGDNPEEALVAARRAVEIATFVALDSAEEAQAAAGRMVNLGPEYEDTQGLLLQAMAETGSVEEAIAGYRDAQAAGVEDGAGFIAHNLSWGLYKAGEHDKALPIIREWLAAHPDPAVNPEYRLILDTAAHIMAAAGQTDEAVDLFLQAADLGGTGERIFYETQLTNLGFAPGEGEEGFEAALRACAATGEACKLYQ